MEDVGDPMQELMSDNKSLEDQFEIVMWEPNMSPHKVPLAVEIARQNPAFGCTYVYQNELTEARVKQGWRVRRDDTIRFVHAPNPAFIDEIVASSSRDAVHLFSGIRWVPVLTEGLKAVRRHGRRFGIMSEPRSRMGLKGYIRYAHSVLAERTISRQCDFVLGIGAHGPKWFCDVGYSADRVFPFAYYSIGETAVRSQEPRRRVTVGFLGRLETVKGFNLFIESIPGLVSFTQVRVAGYGPLKKAIEDIVNQQKGCVEYLGALPMDEVASFLKGIDILVLPSTSDDDGWGAVVAEALHAGCFVIASHLTGASMCLADDRRGYVLSKLTSEEIVRAALLAVQSGLLSATHRNIRSQWASSTLSAEAGAKWLMEILDNVYRHGHVRRNPFS